MKTMLVAAAVACLTLIGTANAVDLPEQKEGLWSNHRQSTDNPGNNKSEQTSTVCRNHAYDQYVLSLTKDTKGCTKANESFQGGKYSVEMHCVIGGTVIDSKGTTTFQGDTAHSESHATYTPAMGGVSETLVVMAQKSVVS